MRYFKKLEGDRLYLSPINIEDAELYTKWINDFDVTVNLLSTPVIYTLEKERAILERLSKDGINLAIIDKETDRVIGNCGLMEVNHLYRKADLGIFIGEKEYWGKGYGTEAIELVLDFGFNILNLNNIMLIVNSFNERAIRCYEKCGFKVIGKRRQAIIMGSETYDECFMDILASEFKKSRIQEKMKKRLEE